MSSETASADLQQKSQTRAARWAAILTMALAFAAGGAISWGKWGDLLIDATVEFDDCRILLNPGIHLYTDIVYPYGPLIPYFNALLFKLFGVNTWVFYGAGLSAAALMTCLIYRVVRLFAGRICGVTAAVAFIFISAFAKLTPNGGFNWVLSYHSAAQYGALLAMASTFFLIRHSLKSRRRDFYISAFFLSLCALTKIESVTAASVPHILFIVTTFWSRRWIWATHAAGYAAAIALAVGVYAYFYQLAGASLFVDNLLVVAFHPSYKMFAMRTMGTDNLEQSLINMLVSIGYFLVVCLIPFLFSALMERMPEKNPLTIRGIHLIAALGAFAIVYFESMETTFRFVPILALGMLIWIIRYWLKYTDLRTANQALMLVWAFVLGSLIRVFFKTVSYHYGFYLLPPGLAALAIFVFKDLPSFRPRSPGIKSLCARTALGFFGGLIVHHLQYTIPAYALNTAEISTPRGSMLIPAGHAMEFNGEKVWVPTGEYYRDLIAFLSTIPRDSRVLIVPQGEGGLCFFSGLENSYRNYVSFVPTVHGRYDDDEFLGVVKASPPDYIIRIAIDLSEYGNTAFGLSYSKKTWEWLAPQYEVFKSYPPRYIIVLKRKADAAK